VDVPRLGDLSGWLVVASLFACGVRRQLLSCGVCVWGQHLPQTRSNAKCSHRAATALLVSQSWPATCICHGGCLVSSWCACRFYHADPHPGNLLKTQDGRLAYIDFGRCRWLWARRIEKQYFGCCWAPLTAHAGRPCTGNLSSAVCSSRLRGLNNLCPMWPTVA
jgi:hypothetical protein